MKDTPDAPEMFVSTANELIYIERNNSIESQCLVHSLWALKKNKKPPRVTNDILTFEFFL